MRMRAGPGPPSCYAVHWFWSKFGPLSQLFSVAQVTNNGLHRQGAGQERHLLESQNRRKGMRTLSRSFKTKSNAEKWARQTEAEIDQKGVRDITQEAKISFGQALHDHIEIEHRECQRQATSDKRKKTCAKKYRGMTDKLNILKTDFEQFNTIVQDQVSGPI